MVDRVRGKTDFEVDSDLARGTAIGSNERAATADIVRRTAARMNALVGTGPPEEDGRFDSISFRASQIQVADSRRTLNPNPAVDAGGSLRNSD